MQTTVKPLKRLATLSALVTGCAFFASAQAQDLGPTLQKIKDTGVISLGIRESSVPFSYYDSQQHTIGYSQSIALRIVDEVRNELKLDKLTVKEMPITSQNRIPVLQNGTIDIECGSTTHTKERANQVAFTNSFFQYGIRLMTKKGSDIKEFADLAGKTVVTTAGTSEDRLLREMNNSKKMNMQLILAKDHADSFLMLKTGRAAAYVNDEPLLYGARANEKNPQDYVVTGAPALSEVYGCMVRKDDPAFKKLADRVIANMQTSGEAEQLYNKWFNQPIAPKGINLDYPLSADNRALFAHPNDLALD